MKTKKFLILAVLVVMVSMLFTGCNHDITEKVEESQIIAEEFLSTKGYEIPRGYVVKFMDENQTKLSVKYEKIKAFETAYDRVEVIFYIVNGKPYIASIANYRMKINYEQIAESKKIASDSLGDVIGNIEDELNVSEITYYENESDKYFCPIYLGIWAAIIIVISIIMLIICKKK